MNLFYFVLELVFVYIACMGFGFIYHIRGKLLFIAPIGSSIIWAVELILKQTDLSVVVRAFLATIAAAVFCEITARILKVPVILFMVIAILPLVPGGGIYYTMEACIKSDYELFVNKGIETIGIAGAIAVAMLLVSTIFRMSTTAINRNKQKKNT